MLKDMIQFSTYQFGKITSTNVQYYDCVFTNCIIDEFIMGSVIQTAIDEHLNAYRYCEFKNCIFPNIQYPERYEKCVFNNNKYHVKDIEKIRSIIDKDTAFNSLPSGDITVYKKALLNDSTNLYADKNYCILELKIPENAKRVKGNENKCRASEAILVRILNLNGEELPNKKAYSHFISVRAGYVDERTEYVVGQTILPDAFDDNPLTICSHGIHFFCTFREATNYYFN